MRARCGLMATWSAAGVGERADVCGYWCAESVVKARFYKLLPFDAWATGKAGLKGCGCTGILASPHVWAMDGFKVPKMSPEKQLQADEKRRREHHAWVKAEQARLQLSNE